MYNIYLKAGDPPFVIIVHFDCYRGSSYFEDLDYPDIEDSEYIVPTIQSIWEFLKGVRDYKRIQFPLNIIFTITTYKVQG